MTVRRAVSWCCVAVAVAIGPATAQGFHARRPNSYRQAQDVNVATVLDGKLAAGEIGLPSEGRSGRLTSLLRELGVPVASQTLVFSKTSLQRHRVSPHSPRAVFFGRDVYVGWVPGAAALEIAVSDPRLGVAFYTLPQDPAVAPRLRRDDSCLSCHATSRTHDEPGILLRSVFADENGDPIASAGEDDVTLRTPLADRWGGWIVTGAIAVDHRGNGSAKRDTAGRWHVPPREAADLGAFEAQFAVADYPARTSDVGTLLVLEHQATVHGRLVRAALQMRCLLQGDREINAMLGEEGLRERTADLADDLSRAIVADLLGAHEVSLRDAGIRLEPAFAAAYAGLWPVDDSGVRLGRLQLRERVFELPLSPLVHSVAFAALPDELRELVLRRLRRAFEQGRLPGGASVTAEERAVLHTHLRQTLPGYAN